MRVGKFWTVSVFAAALAAGCATPAPFPTPPADVAHETDEIDLSAYQLTFADEFDRIDVSDRRCDTQWIAHTPWNGDFGAARFSGPSRGFPFVARDGVLRIEARKEAGGPWLSGLLSSWNTCGEGFAQQYGYFEISAKLPDGDGLWPAFWLIGVDRSRFTAEIDIFEYHTVRPGRFTSSTRVHPHLDDVKASHTAHFTEVEPGSLAADYHRWGVAIEEEETIFYFDRREIARTPTIDAFRQPMFVLLNLAMEGGEISDATPKQNYMFVDYVRVYTRHSGEQPGAP